MLGAPAEFNELNLSTAVWLLENDDADFSHWVYFLRRKFPLSVQIVVLLTFVKPR